MWRTTEDIFAHGKTLRISIHDPRVEDDRLQAKSCRVFREFQSTSPVWRTTSTELCSCRACCHFNPRPPCGGRRLLYFLCKPRFQFQSTSPVWRMTGRSTEVVFSFQNFNPRPPCGGRHKTLNNIYAFAHISIHVPRVEDDAPLALASEETTRFQSTSPVWRTTIISQWLCDRNRVFQSTSPVWRTTTAAIQIVMSLVISIHVPRVEDDCTLGLHNPVWSGFQSTSPVWRTTPPPPS